MLDNLNNNAGPRARDENNGSPHSVADFPRPQKPSYTYVYHTVMGCRNRKSKWKVCLLSAWHPPYSKEMPLTKTPKALNPKAYSARSMQRVEAKYCTYSSPGAVLTETLTCWEPKSFAHTMEPQFQKDPCARLCICLDLSMSQRVPKRETAGHQTPARVLLHASEYLTSPKYRVGA